MVLEKAAELARALVESDEFKNFSNMRDEVENDSMAAGLMSSYYEKEQELHRAMQDPSDSEKIDSLNQVLDEIRGKIRENDALENLAQAQAGFQYLMNQVNDVIGRHINPESGGCSDEDCSSCSGCH